MDKNKTVGQPSRLAISIKLLSLGFIQSLSAGGGLIDSQLAPPFVENGMNSIVKGVICDQLGGRAQNHFCNFNPHWFREDIEDLGSFTKPTRTQPRSLANFYNTPAENNPPIGDCKYEFNQPYELALITQTFPENCTLVFNQPPTITRTAYAKDGQVFIGRSAPTYTDQPSAYHVDSWQFKENHDPQNLAQWVPGQVTLVDEKFQHLGTPFIPSIHAPENPQAVLVLARRNLVKGIHFASSSMPYSSNGCQWYGIALSESLENSYHSLTNVTFDIPLHPCTPLSLSGGTPVSVGDKDSSSNSGTATFSKNKASPSGASAAGTSSTTTSTPTAIRKQEGDDEDDEDEEKRKARLRQEERDKEAAMSSKGFEADSMFDSVVGMQGLRDQAKVATRPVYSEPWVRGGPFSMALYRAFSSNK